MNVQTDQIQYEAEGGTHVTMDNHSRRSSRPQLKAVAPMLVMVLVVAACGSSEDDASPATTVQPPATSAPSQPVTVSGPVSTYDGAGCAYDGAAEFDLGSRVTFTFVNVSDETNVGFGVWAVPDGTTAADILEKGIFEVVGATSVATPAFYAAQFAPTARDTEYERTITLDTPGHHAVNCFDIETDLDHATIFTVSDG